LKVCSGCRLAYFHSIDCLKASWKAHKPMCTEAQAFKNKPVHRALKDLGRVIAESMTGKAGTADNIFLKLHLKCYSEQGRGVLFIAFETLKDAHDAIDPGNHSVGQRSASNRRSRSTTHVCSMAFAHRRHCKCARARGVHCAR
jgi:hypothetical protein